VEHNTFEVAVCHDNNNDSPLVERYLEDELAKRINISEEIAEYERRKDADLRNWEMQKRNLEYQFWIL